MWLLQRAPDYQNVPVPSQDSMSTVSEEEAAMIRTAKSMRLAEKVKHDEEMAEHLLPDVIPQPPNPSSPSAKLRLRPNSRCFGKTKEAAITLNKKEAKEEEETPVLLTKTQKKELKKERKARQRSLNASRRKAEDDEFEEALAEANSASAPASIPNVMPPPPPPRQPEYDLEEDDVFGDTLAEANNAPAPAPNVPTPPPPPGKPKEVRVELPVVYCDDESASPLSGDGLGTARDWQDIE